MKIHDVLAEGLISLLNDINLSGLFNAKAILV